MEKMEVPQNALQLMDKECFAQVVHEENSKPKLRMMAYSGKVIKGHWWWGNLAIDMEGMKFSKGKFPILENHMQDRKIAFSNGKPIIKDNQLFIDEDKVEFVDTEPANEFIKLSKQGFPYESSIYAKPLAIERLEQGASAEVNGYNLKGPATIWRQSEFKEASVCVFGWDSNTHSSAFARDIELDVEVSQLKMTNETIQTEEEVIQVPKTLEELKSENPEVFGELMQEARAGVQKEIEDKLKAEHEKELSQMRNDKDKLQERVLELEKKDAIRSENEIRTRAASIWSSKLSESVVPEHLHEKVSQHVSYSKFVKDGVLDEAKFGEAIDAEIKDWVERGVTQTVLGVGFAQRKEEGEADAEKKMAEQDDKLVDHLVTQAGGTVKK